MHSQNQKNAHEIVISKAKNVNYYVPNIDFFLGGSAPEPPSMTSFELGHDTWILKKIGPRPAVKKYVSMIMLTIGRHPRK